MIVESLAPLVLGPATAAAYADFSMGFAIALKAARAAPEWALAALREIEEMHRTKHPRSFEPAVIEERLREFIDEHPLEAVT